MEIIYKSNIRELIKLNDVVYRRYLKAPNQWYTDKANIGRLEAIALEQGYQKLISKIYCDRCDEEIKDKSDAVQLCGKWMHRSISCDLVSELIYEEKENKMKIIKKFKDYDLVGSDFCFDTRRYYSNGKWEFDHDDSETYHGEIYSHNLEKLEKEYQELIGVDKKKYVRDYCNSRNSCVRCVLWSALDCLNESEACYKILTEEKKKMKVIDISETVLFDGSRCIRRSNGVWTNMEGSTSLTAPEREIAYQAFKIKQVRIDEIIEKIIALKAEKKELE